MTVVFNMSLIPQCRAFWQETLRACALQKKFGEKVAGEIESEKGHTCIPMDVRTQKARLACVTAGSKAGQFHAQEPQVV